MRKHPRIFVFTSLTLLICGLPALAVGVDEAAPADPAMPMTRVSVDGVASASTFPILRAPELGGFTATSMPKALVVHVDPHENTLTAAARDRIAMLLMNEGWEVVIRDLYRSGFDPVARAEEISFNSKVVAERPPEIRADQDLVRDADALILIYPLWWKQPPAMMKGWMDRIFTYGFAYEFVEGSQDSLVSLLAGKTVFTINVVASHEGVFKDLGYEEYLDMADRSLFDFSGIEVLGRHIIYSSTDMDLAAKAACLEDLATLTVLLNPVSP